ncbi:serine palmitoyltransferase-like protein [Lactarius hatsudake]|nr:serine palmitoyltransferase-like protein [Lactarius hatsudake]
MDIKEGNVYRPGQACGSIQGVEGEPEPEVTYATFPDHDHHSVSALEPLHYIESPTRTIPVKRSLKPSLRFAPFGPLFENVDRGSASEWTPEPLDALHTQEEQRDLASAPVVSGANRPWPKLANTGKQVLNLSSYDFTRLAGNETSEVRAIETLWKYGVSCCGPLGFHGTIVSAFAKRGDIINFAVQKGLETSRSTPRRSVPERRERMTERFGPLTRRFIVTEGIFEKEPWSIYQNCNAIRNGRRIGPQWVQLIERYLYGASKSPSADINRISFVSSAVIPAVSASEGINILPNMPSFPSTQENVGTIRVVPVEATMHRRST